MKILPQTYLWTGKILLNFGSPPPTDAHPGILKRIFQHCNIRHFPHFGSYLRKYTDRIFMKILSNKYLLTRNFPLNFRSHTHHPDPWRRFALESSC